MTRLVMLEGYRRTPDSSVTMLAADGWPPVSKGRAVFIVASQSVHGFPALAGGQPAPGPELW
ncbi:hypothetical protein [Amycolatopsis sp. A1MSW2902]|uniref:hypothetical protein n=1 Tax=Amycolatopsis sp. A1MSW2902 TaxID=687413 RepID=UPI00307DB396